MSTYALTRRTPYPDLESGDVWVFTESGEYDPPPIIRGVTEFTLMAGPGAGPEFAQGRDPGGGEDPACVRVMDGCDRFSMVGFDCSGAYHGVRITGSEHCRILHCTLHDNEMEGLLAGAVPWLEVGWCVSFQNGGGNNDRAHGFYCPSYNTDGSNLHHLHAYKNTGSGLQVNGTAEIGGVITNLHAWQILLEDNGVEGTPNLSIIGVQGGRWRKITTKGGRGGVRLFADGGKPCAGNKFFDCLFDQEGTSFSVDSQERTRGTQFNEGCVVTGPEMTRSSGASLPVVVPNLT